MNTPAPKTGILQTAVYNFKQAAKRLRLSPSTTDHLVEPKEKIEVTINPALPDGSISHIKTFLVRHSDSIGPSKGGIRMAPNVTMDDITGLAMEMTWKTSLIGVPFGGGKSGICCDPAHLTPDAKEVVIRSFTRGAMRHIGPEIYIPAPDMGTNESDMGHLRDCVSYSRGTSITNGCFVTGKPIILGGIEGRKEATGKGVVYTILAACGKFNLDIKKLKVAVQGFGNVGSVAALEVARCGATVIAVADESGGLLNKQGLNLDALQQYHLAHGHIKGFPDAQAMPREDIFAVDCDILIPAAAGSQITADNADLIKARIIAEGANAPTIPAADDILNRRQIFVIPDILCNAGGVFVSYLEYTQETQREQMTLAAVEQRLRERMTQRFEEVFQRSRAQNIPMRFAATDIAVNRVVDAITARGLLP